MSFLGEQGRRSELFNLLLKKAKELGRVPTFEEVLEDSRLPHPNDFAFYYGSFSEAQKEVGYKLRVEENGGYQAKRKVVFSSLSPEKQAEFKKKLDDSLRPMRYLKQLEEEQTERARKKRAQMMLKRAIKKRQKAEAIKAEVEVVIVGVTVKVRIEIPKTILEGDAMVENEQLLQELVDFSVENGRLPRVRARGGNESDEGKLPREIEVYTDKLGGGSWKKVVELIIGKLPEDKYYDSATKQIKTRARKRRVSSNKVSESETIPVQTESKTEPEVRLKSEPEIKSGSELEQVAQTEIEVLPGQTDGVKVVKIEIEVIVHAKTQ